MTLRFLFILLSACSSAPLKHTYVALQSLSGTDTSKRILEVALLRFIDTEGSFEILPRRDTNTPCVYEPIEGARFAFCASMDIFSINTRTGHDLVHTENDTQLAAETGSGVTDHLSKMRIHDAHIAGSITVIDLTTQTKTVHPFDMTKQIKLPTEEHTPPLRLLEAMTFETLEPIFKQCSSQIH